MKENVSSAVLRRNEIRYGGYLDLTLYHPAIAKAAKPGQFVMIKGHRGLAPILGRPFDIADTDQDKGEFRLVVKPVGKGTELMRHLTAGAVLPVNGPLGNAVEFSNYRSIAVLVRGVGAAAVTMLIKKARKEGIDAVAFISANTAERLVCLDDLERNATKIFIATDDGSRGYKGNATDLLEKYIDENSVEAVYTCGSRRFARFVDSLDTGKAASGYVFLEGYMACGVGNCHGCAVKKRNGEGYVLVCRDGPVFRTSEVVLP